MPASRAVLPRSVLVGVAVSVAVSVAVGVAFGVVDFLWIKFLPSVLGGLGNSPAVWAVAAFVLGRQARTGPVRAAAAGAVMLVVAVPSYYLAATVVQHDDVRAVWGPAGLVWMLFGVLAGALFGVAGAVSRSAGWQGAVGLALPGAVMWAEAGALLYRGRSADLWTVAVEAAIGAVVIVLAGRSARRSLAALAVAVPLAVAGFLAYYAFDLGGLR